MIQRAVISLALAALTALPAAAQSSVQLAVNNAYLAMQLCIQNYGTPDDVVNAFWRAGFTYSPEDFGGGDILHWFETPGNSVQVAVITDGSLECRIGTNLWGVEQMVPFAVDSFTRITNGIPVTMGSPEGQNILPGSAQAQQQACSGFNVLLPRTLLWVQIERQGNDGTCISDGTSVMRMIF